MPDADGGSEDGLRDGVEEYISAFSAAAEQQLPLEVMGDDGTKKRKIVLTPGHLVDSTSANLPSCAMSRCTGRRVGGSSPRL